jgi:hypothetical protein
MPVTRSKSMGAARPTDTEIALAVRGGGAVHGRLLLTAATHVVRPSAEQAGGRGTG